MEWISVRERFPKEKEKILVLKEDGSVEITDYRKVLVYDNIGRAVKMGHFNYCGLEGQMPTHWCKIEKPKK